MACLVNEKVLSTVVWGNETKAFGAIEPPAKEQVA